MKKIYLLCFLVKLSCLTAIAQKNSAYIIESGGDTLLVEEIMKLESPDKVKVQANGSTMTYHAGEILGFGFEDRVFLSKNVKRAAEEKEKFIEEVVRGYMSLYRTNYPGEKKKFYVSKLHDSLTYEISRSYYHNFIAFYFQDCPEIVSHNQELWKSRFKYDLQAMFELVKQYNECLVPNAKQLVRIFPEKRTVFYVVAGLGYLNIRYKGEAAASVLPLAGAGIKFRYSKRFSVGGELLLTRKGGTIDYSFEKLDGARYYVQLPGLLGFTFNPNSKSQLSLLGGGVFGYAFSDTYETIDRPDELLLLEERFKFSTGYLIGLEFARELNNDKKLALSGRYEDSRFGVNASNASFGSSVVTFHERSFSLLLKYEL